MFLRICSKMERGFKKRIPQVNSIMFFLSSIVTVPFPFQIIGLTYTHMGGAILALAFNAVHKLWKWQTSDGKVWLPLLLRAACPTILLLLHLALY